MSLDIRMPWKYTPNDHETVNWLAAHSPIIITAIRKDMSVVYTDTGIYGLLVVSSNSFACTVGDKIYLSSEGIYEGLYTVTHVVDGFNRYVDATYSVHTYSGYANNMTSRPNYYIKLRAESVTKLESTIETVATQIAYPDPKGWAKIDVSRIAQKLISMDDTCDHASVNVADDFLSMGLRPYFTEVWDGSAEAETIGDATVVTNCAMQVGHKYDSNLVEWFPSHSSHDSAKWLTPTNRLRYYNDYPFDLSFILPLAFNVDTIDSEELTYASGILDDTIGYGIDESQSNRINRYTPQGPYGDGIDAATVRLLKSGGTIIEAITLLIADVKCNPVYLKWVNGLSGWSYFMFDVTQTRNVKTSTQGLFSRFIEKLSEAQSTAEFIDKNATPEMVIGADMLTTDDLLLMESLICSPRVQMLTNPSTWQDDGEKWQTVRVEVGTYQTRVTKNTQGRIEMKMMLPDILLQNQ